MDQTLSIKMAIRSLLSLFLASWSPNFSMHVSLGKHGGEDGLQNFAQKSFYQK